MAGFVDKNSSAVGRQIGIRVKGEGGSRPDRDPDNVVQPGLFRCGLLFQRIYVQPVCDIAYHAPYGPAAKLEKVFVPRYERLGIHPADQGLQLLPDLRVMFAVDKKVAKAE